MAYIDLSYNKAIILEEILEDGVAHTKQATTCV